MLYASGILVSDQITGPALSVDLNTAFSHRFAKTLPLVAVRAGVAAKVGHDIARKEFERFAQLFGRRPFMRGQHETAEAAAFGLHALDLGDGVLRRADDPIAAVRAGARRDFMGRLA